MLSRDDIQAALLLTDFDPDAAHRLMAPGSRDLMQKPGAKTRQAGVLVLLYPDADDWQLILTRRADTLRGHSGQVSFPGGRRDPEDRSFMATALRETCEELGVCDDHIQILGQLTPIYIPPSDFRVYPTVGVMTYSPQIYPNPAEVAEVFSVSLQTLLDEQVKLDEYRDFRGMPVKIPYYWLEGHKVWGATAIMLSELEQRLRVILREKQQDSF